MTTRMIAQIIILAAFALMLLGMIMTLVVDVKKSKSLDDAQWHYLKDPDAMTDEEWNALMLWFFKRERSGDTSGVSPYAVSEMPDELKALYSQDAYPSFSEFQAETAGGEFTSTWTASDGEDRDKSGE